MPVLTFEDVTPGGVPVGKDGLPRVRVSTSNSGALTFDEFTPESTGAKVGRYAKDIGQSVISGLDKGVAGLAGLPADAALGINAVVNYGKSKVQGRPFEEVEAESDRNAVISRDSVRKYGGKAFHDASPLKHTPTTTAGEYAQSGAEFVPSALFGPGSLARNAVALGVAPGLASEAAGQATKGTAYEPYARAGTAVLGTAVGQWATAPNAAGAAVSRAAQGAAPQQIDAAEQLFQRAQRMGVPLTRAEAVQHVTGGATNLGNLQRVVEGSGELRPLMAARPGQVEDAARTQFGRLGPISPDPSSIGPAVGEAATGLVDDVRGAINNQTRQLYQAAELDRVPAAQYQRLAQDPRFDNALQTIRNHPEIGPELAHLPDNAVTVVDQVKKLLNTRSEVTPVADATERYLASLRGTAGTNAANAGTTSSAAYAQALAEQTRLREQYLNPLMAGPIGKLAKSDMPTKRAIAALFPENPLPNSQQEIGQAVAAVAHRNPGAARQLVRTHVESVFNEATQRLQSGANEFGGAGFAAVLRGNPQQAANLEAAVTALRGGQAYQGFNRFLEVLEAQGARQRIGSQTAFNQEVQSELKRGGTVAEALSSLASGGIKLPSKINQRIEQWRMGGNVSEIADILTNPDSARLFRQLATTPANSAKAGAIVARLAYIADRSKD
jgi:hypothetical protein